MKFPEKYRLAGEIDKNGLFIIPFKGTRLKVIASYDWGDWEHVSVSVKNRCPIWDEMCFIKDLFFDEEDCVTQYHPPKSEYVNFHPYCLHLWKSSEIIRPTQSQLIIKDNKEVKNNLEN